jgi:hypothetical protein
MRNAYSIITVLPGTTYAVAVDPALPYHLSIMEMERLPCSMQMAQVLLLPTLPGRPELMV